MRFWKSWKNNPYTDRSVIVQEILNCRPYCLSPAFQCSGFCPSCLDNITNHAAHENSHREYAVEPHKACR